MAAANMLYERVVVVTESYLGPASERFINRQIVNHLHKDPVALKPADLPSLVEWIRITISVLTEDSDMVEDYVKELSTLTTKQAKS